MHLQMGFIGGLLIGAAAIVLFATWGRIMGISGMFDNMIRGIDWQWRALFIGGTLIGALGYHLSLGIAPPPPSTAGPVVAILAGLLVGFGTRLGSGCTSGHGVCGIGRLSPRSIVATAVFIGMGVVTVTLIRHFA